MKETTNSFFSARIAIRSELIPKKGNKVAKDERDLMKGFDYKGMVKDLWDATKPIDDKWMRESIMIKMVDHILSIERERVWRKVYEDEKAETVY